MTNDKLTARIISLITTAGEPLSNAEIRKRIGASETQLRWRIPELLASGKVSGKVVPGGRGVWIWWKRL